MDKRKNRGGAVPFSAPSILMIVFSFFAAFFGFSAVLIYQTLPIGQPGHTIFFTAFYIGILNLVALILGLLSAFLLLQRKRIPLAVAIMAVIFCFGFVTLWLPTFESFEWQTGLYFALPMFVFSGLALSLVLRNITLGKYAQVIQRGRTAREGLFVGFGVAGVGFTLMGIVTCLLVNLVPIFRAITYVFSLVGVAFLIVGIPLLAETYLLKRNRQTLKAAGAR